MTSLTVVVPAFNEAESLPVFLPQLIAHCQPRGWQVIVVNDGSTDATGQVLAGYAGHETLRILHHKVNRGYGGALKTGLAYAETEYVVTMDADGQHCLSDIDRLLQAMHETDADMVVGRRARTRSASWYRELGKWLIRRITGLLLPLDIKDLNSGFKLYRTRLVRRYLHLCPDSMAFSDVIALIFISQRYLVIEHPVQINERLSGKSTISTRTAFETVFEILNIVMMFNPMRIFVPAALFCVAVGVLWGLPFVLLGRGVSVASMLAIVTGILFLFLGLVAQQLSLIRRESAMFYQDYVLDKEQ